MSKKMVLMVMAVFFIMGGFCAVSPNASADCRKDCYASCCGDEGICNGDDEMSCVSDCLKDCPSDGGTGAQSNAGAGNGSTSDGVSTDTREVRPYKPYLQEREVIEKRT